MTQLLPHLHLFTRSALAVITILLASCISFAQDLPTNVTPNIQTAPAGTIVIPMDNTNQANASGLFNLKAYGLAVYLLSQKYNLKWVIRTGKGKDEIDFSGTAEKMTPAYAAPATRDFRAGALLIFPEDTSHVFTRITAFNMDLPASGRVQTFRLTSAVDVDVRYNLTKTPRIAVLSDGGSQSIHVNYLIAASMPASAYTIFNATSLTSDCFTFAAEPHLTDAGPWNVAAKNYILSGGNFLAQCHAIETYENLAGYYQTTTGLVTVNASFSGVTYPAADMAFSQFQGAYNPAAGGSVKNWQHASGSLQNNHMYKVIGNAGNPAHIGASVSKLGSGPGGLVFFLGNHNFSQYDAVQINGIRMFLNAALIPSNMECNTSYPVLPVKLQQFTIQQSDTWNKLYWLVNEESSQGGTYSLEHSFDGKRFTTIHRIPAKNYGIQGYNYTHDRLVKGKNHYRLRMEQTGGSIRYSSVITVVNFADYGMSLFPNPAKSSATLTLPASKYYHIELHDLSGKKIRTFRHVNENPFRLPVADLSPGTYFVLAVSENGASFREKLVVVR